jgi:hypothetical protein
MGELDSKKHLDKYGLEELERLDRFLIIFIMFFFQEFDTDQTRTRPWTSGLLFER